MADPRAIHEFLTGEVEATTLLLGDFVDLDAQSGYTTLKMSVSDLGEVILEDIEYTQDLTTVDKTIIGAINENKSVIGYSYDEYDPTTAYSKDDLCIYNNVLYKALQATTGNLPTNTTYWEQTSIADEINKLKENQDSLGDMILNLYNTNTQYYRGDVVEFYGDIYKCIQTPPSAGYSPSGSPAYWSIENLSSQVSDIARCMNIRETFGANTSIVNAISAIITKYGKNSMMGGFIITGYGFVHFSLSFSDDGQGGGYVVANNKGTGGNIPVMYIVQYVNGTVSLGYFS